MLKFKMVYGLDRSLHLIIQSVWVLTVLKELLYANMDMANAG
jgi:hypothetical protein